MDGLRRVVPVPLVRRGKWVIFFLGEGRMGTDYDLLTEENNNIRVLRFSSDLLVQTLMTQPIRPSEAESMIEGVRRLCGKLFPGKEHVFDLIYLPRFRRALREAGHLGASPALRVVEANASGKPADESPV
jgi:hypothetical protein